MRRLVLALLLASTAGAARAEVPVEAGVDPARLALAHRLVAASGGVEATRRTMSGLMDVTTRLVTKDLPPEQARLQVAIHRDLVDEISSIVPSMMVEAERSYARHLSLQELSDYVAWVESPSGRAVHAKSTVIQTEVIAAEGPMLRALLPQVHRRVLERVCAELKCSATDRQVLAARLTSASPSSAAGG